MKGQIGGGRGRGKRREGEGRREAGKRLGKIGQGVLGR